MRQKDYLATNKIVNHVGSVYYNRGMGYFKENRVSGIELSGLRIFGLVKGSGYKTYKSVIYLDGRGGIKSSSCSCPIGGECKHIAALGLAFLDWGNESQETKIKTFKKAAWRREFDKIADNDKNKKEETLMYEMELVFELRSAQDLNLRAEEGYALFLRPRGINKFSGKKSFSAFEWREAQYEYDKNMIRESANYFFKELYKPLILATANNYNYYWREQKWLPVTSANAGMVWHLLENHRFYKVNLVFGSAASIPITVCREKLSIKAVISDIYKGFKLKNELIGDGKILNPDFVLMFGDVPQFALIGNSLIDPLAANKQKDIAAEISLYSVNEMSDMRVFK